MRRRYLFMMGFIGLTSLQARADQNLIEGKARQTGHKHILMGTLGDSMTAAALADTRSDQPLPFLPLFFNLFDLPSLFEDGLVSTLVDNKRKLSWASGNAFPSHYMRLKDYYKKQSGKKANLTIANVAVSGAVTDDLAPQADQLVQMVNSGDYDSLPYVTLLIGANDVCGGVSTDRVKANLQGVFAKLNEVRQNEPVRILVSSIPQIAELGQPKIRNYQTGNGYRCKFIRDEILNYCDGTLTTWQGADQEAQSTLLVAQMNDAIREAAVEGSKDYPNIQVSYSPALRNYELSAELLAADCFHPNAQTHEIISEQTWKDQPWFQ